MCSAAGWIDIVNPGEMECAILAPKALGRDSGEDPLNSLIGLCLRNDHCRKGQVAIRERGIVHGNGNPALTMPAPPVTPQLGAIALRTIAPYSAASFGGLASSLAQ